MLISAIQQTNDLSVVHLGVNFSCRFTMQEVEERWYALLYNLNASQLAIEAMQGLHPGVVTMALNNALWSQEEEAVLARIPPVSDGRGMWVDGLGVWEEMRCVCGEYCGVCGRIWGVCGRIWVGCVADTTLCMTLLYYAKKVALAIN